MKKKNATILLNKQTRDYEIVSDDARNWKIVANRFIPRGEAVTPKGSTAWILCEPSQYIEIELRETGETKTVLPHVHAVPVDDSCVPLGLELPWCFANHSCNPNTFDFWDEKDPESLVASEIVACRDICKGEELTFDYCLEQYQYLHSFNCGCNQQNCRGHVSGFQGLSVQEQTRLFDKISPFVRRRHLEAATASNMTLLTSVGNCESASAVGPKY